MEYIFEMEHWRNRINDALKALQAKLAMLSPPPNPHAQYFECTLIVQHLYALSIELNDTYVRQNIGWFRMWLLRRKVKNALREAYALIDGGMSFDDMMKTLKNGLQRSPEEVHQLISSV